MAVLLSKMLQAVNQNMATGSQEGAPGAVGWRTAWERTFIMIIIFNL